LQRTVSSTYDAFGAVLTATDAAGVVTSFEYDSAGNLEKTTAAVGTSSEAMTDLVRGDPAHPDDVTTTIDARGKHWISTYDPGNGRPRLDNGRRREHHDARSELARVGDEHCVAPLGNVAGATATDQEDHRTHFEYNL
jgi:YD repeat-containing protein